MRKNQTFLTLTRFFHQLFVTLFLADSREVELSF